MTNRRTFIKGLSAMGALSVMPRVLQSTPVLAPGKDKIWGLIISLTKNGSSEYIKPGFPLTDIFGYRDYLWLSEKLWNDAFVRMAEEGINMALIQVGNSIKLDSHPEIAIRDAWSTTRLRAELDKIRKLGIEPIPLLNFSATHDVWLKQYSRMLSTEEYYKVCSDVIREVADLFDKPRFFHLGMDEETANHQKNYDYVVIRQNDLWWKDLYFYLNEVEKAGSRPWIWADYVWNNPETFYKKMPKSVLQSNWYYGSRWDWDSEVDPKEQYPRFRTYVKAYIDLEKNGYDQMPTAANWGALNYEKTKETTSKSLINTVKFCNDHVNDSRLFGFLHTSWYPTIEKYREPILDSIRLAGEAKRWFEKKG